MGIPKWGGGGVEDVSACALSTSRLSIMYPIWEDRMDIWSQYPNQTKMLI